ncbi:hypothetical protein A4A49_53952, partial [Nicotiana attenuata]
LLYVQLTTAKNISHKGKTGVSPALSANSIVNCSISLDRYNHKSSQHMTFKANSFVNCSVCLDRQNHNSSQHITL